MRRAGVDDFLGGEPRVDQPDQLDLFGMRSIDRWRRICCTPRRVGVADMRQIDEFGVAV